jgi:hypothetical protein
LLSRVRESHDTIYSEVTIHLDGRELHGERLNLLSPRVGLFDGQSASMAPFRIFRPRR